MSDIDTSEDNNPLEGVEDIEIQEEMEQSFLDYAMSVIVARALPDARDGLNPSIDEYCGGCTTQM